MFLDDKLTREVYDDRYCELGKFDIFESIMEKVIVGEMAEYGIANPYKLIFCLREWMPEYDI